MYKLTSVEEGKRRREEGEEGDDHEGRCDGDDGTELRIECIPFPSRRVERGLSLPPRGSLVSDRSLPIHPTTHGLTRTRTDRESERSVSAKCISLYSGKA